MELTTEPHRVESERFAHELAGLLEKGLDENAYERLVLIAPPQFLGLLRAAISERVAQHVELALDKDYTALEPADLADRLPF